MIIGFSRNKLQYQVNEKFFDTWTPQMAYILGFTFADGNVHRTSLSWDLQLKDRSVLAKINQALESNYPITLQRKSSYRLRINNQILIKGAINRGLLPKKNIRNQLPLIPPDCLRHFIRGYIDGDGWLVIRATKSEFDLGCSSGNNHFLKDLVKIISQNLNIKSAKVRIRKKLTPKGIISVTYMFEYFSLNAFKVAQWLYKDLTNDDLYLKRKYHKYLVAEKLFAYIRSGSKKVRIVQKQKGKSINEILEDLYINKHYDGVYIAKLLHVHSSSIYRWLAKTGIKYPQRRNLHGQKS